MAHPLGDLRAFLGGPWSVARLMIDRRGGGGSFLGWARFEAAGPDLVYRERGRAVLGTYRGPAYRDYRYSFPAPARAEVAFADGRPFHPLDLATGRCAARHRCGADLYRGRFVVLSADRWRSDWRVEGPRKALVISTLYLRRCEAASAAAGAPSSML